MKENGEKANGKKLIYGIIFFLFTSVFGWGVWMTNKTWSAETKQVAMEECIKNIKEKLGDMKQDMDKIKTNGETQKEMQQKIIDTLDKVNKKLK